jgi:hypothetical protein
LVEWLRERMQHSRPDISLQDPLISADAGYVPDPGLDELRQIARSRGGECLSRVFRGVMEKHEFRCARGHAWLAIAANVKARTWCPKCKPETIARATRDPNGLARMKEVAVQRGGVFLSDAYTSVNDRYRWRCAKGHEWETTPSDVLKGTWCPKCAKVARRDTLETMRQIAAERGGQCLSDAYVHQHAKLLWRCAKGHEWWARPGNVKNGRSWCPTCSRTASGR